MFRRAAERSDPLRVAAKLGFFIPHPSSLIPFLRMTSVRDFAEAEWVLF